MNTRRNEEVIKVYVGADRSQLLAIQVLEHSIKRHTSAPVEVIPMVDLDIPKPEDPRNSQRTGFSFSRFCIPALANYRGKAIYMDADMQVFKDIRALWELPFNGSKVLIQQEVKHTEETLAKENAPSTRKKQCAVMLMDCENLDWDIHNIIRGLNEGTFSYDQLLSDLCILDERDIGYTIPFEWNSLEFYDSETCLIHYTDMGTQPWVSTKNPNAEIWFSEVRAMLSSGDIDWAMLEQEIQLGHFRPSLLRDIRYGHRIPKFLRGFFNRQNEAIDKLHGFIPHRAVYEAKRIRGAAIKEYERLMSKGPV